jgi:hypothetical protein
LGEEKGRSVQVASKTVALFKSPHTGNLGESHAERRSAIAIRMAGYAAIVIKGKEFVGGRKEILENLKGHKHPLKIVISVHTNSNLTKT